MERYNRRTNGYEEQDSSAMTRNGWQQRMRRFTNDCDDCGQWNNTYNQNGCDDCGCQNNTYMQRNDTYNQNGCDDCGRKNNAYTQRNDTYNQNGCDDCGRKNNAYTQRNDTYDQNGCDGCGRKNNTYMQRRGSRGNDQLIIDHADCDADDASAIWTECDDQTCGEKNCGCNRAQQGNAFTYDNIRRDQRNGSCWDNWFHGDNSTL